MESNGRIAVLTCGLVLAATASMNASAQQFQSGARYDEKWLSETAANLNRSLPKEVDAETRWDRVTPGPGIGLTYSYTLIKQEAGKVDLEQFNSAMQVLLRKAVCGRAGMRELMKNGVKLAYVYRGNDGRFVSLLEVVDPRCG